MAVDGILLSAIKHDLEQNLIDARIDKIYQPEKTLLTFQFRQTGKNLNLLASIHPERSRVHITELNFDNPSHPPDFCMLLRKYLTHGHITDMKQPGFERMLVLEIKNNNRTLNLILEIMGRYSNIILVDENLEVLDAMKRINKESSHRQLYPGVKYQTPPGQDKLDPLEVTEIDFFEKIPPDFKKYCFRALLYNFRGVGPYSAKEIIHRAGIDYEQAYTDLKKEQKKKIWDSFSRIFEKVKNNNYQPAIGIDREERIQYTSAFPLTHMEEVKTIEFANTGTLFDFYYEKEVKQKQFRELKERLLGIINDYLKKNNKQQKKQYDRLKESKNADKYRKQGELIKANIYQLEKGMQQAELTNYYDSEQDTIEISLDPELTPAENAQKYFKKYEKAKKSKKYIKRELGKLKHEEKYLKQVKLNLQQADSELDLQEIEDELKDEGYIEKNRQVNKNKRQSQKPQPPHKFKSSAGYDILVGRNNRQNDYLTKKMANDQDLWLHTKKIAGSHVVVRNHTGKEIPEETIEEAAVLAAYHSNARMSQNVPIDYTEVKYVNKPKGAKPGLVYYDEYQTIYVNPDQELVEKLKVED
ncbi:MAG: Rqc2 family fibronectin-binding protein [bacterium]